MTQFSVNGRVYRPPPCPIVGICFDGCADEYLDAALDRDLMPNLKRMALGGFRGLARAAMPTFTNVNNASIATGAPPSVHGICGNYFFDTRSGEEVMMNSSQFLRADTIFAAAQRAGRKAAVVTAKDKLRDILGAALAAAGGTAFSAEKAKGGPPIYSAEASLFVLRAGVGLAQSGAADFLYLSTTDFIQHKHGPSEPDALDFYAAVDRELGNLIDSGALVGLTADHGMNAKQKPDGSPNVLYLETALNERFGPGFRVILPITDPYVAHHGALGSFAQVYLPVENRPPLAAVIDFLRESPGITEVLDSVAAARLMQLPPDRIGEVIVVSGRDMTVGRARKWHDLDALAGPLRSHGGRYEEMVPFILSAPLQPEFVSRATSDLRNFDLFDFLCNGTPL